MASTKFLDKPYNRLSPYKLEELVKDEKWITNRALFLINLEDKHYERFTGGYSETHEDWLLTREYSFEQEYKIIQTRCRKQFNRAFGIWSKDWETNSISYER